MAESKEPKRNQNFRFGDPASEALERLAEALGCSKTAALEMLLTNSFVGLLISSPSIQPNAETPAVAALKALASDGDYMALVERLVLHPLTPSLLAGRTEDHVTISEATGLAQGAPQLENGGWPVSGVFLVRTGERELLDPLAFFEGIRSAKIEVDEGEAATGYGLVDPVKSY